VNDINTTIREALNASCPNPNGYPEDGKLVTINFVQGFEKFGAYETWGCGWRVTGRDFSFEDKDLGAAVAAWSLAVWEEYLA
jgi:hypothetical protein